jgi:hypothetical protein
MPDGVVRAGRPLNPSPTAPTRSVRLQDSQLGAGEGIGHVGGQLACYGQGAQAVPQMQQAPALAWLGVRIAQDVVDHRHNAGCFSLLHRRDAQRHPKTNRITIATVESSEDGRFAAPTRGATRCRATSYCPSIPRVDLQHALGRAVEETLLGVFLCRWRLRARTPDTGRIHPGSGRNLAVSPSRLMVATAVRPGPV